MGPTQALRIGVAGLGAHKLRSMLTALGIIFGVASVISMLSIGDGARQEALEQFELMGIHNIIVNDEPIEDDEEGEGRTNAARGLTLADGESILATNPLVSVVVPLREEEAEARHDRRRQDVTLVGTTPEWMQAMNQHVAAGRFFNHLEVLETSRVCVLGAAIKRELFHFDSALGERVKLGSDWYTVVGVLAPKGIITDEDLGPGRDQNRDVLVPVTCTLHRFSREAFASELDALIVRVHDGERIREAAGIVDRMMKRRHQDQPDYSILIPEELLQRRQATQRIFNIVMGAIAGISLVVGGIGIMNIMLASILERTREIGIRRAVGATGQEVMLQFLLEALAVSLLGGIVGVGLGFGLTRIIAGYAGWRTVVSLSTIVLAFGVSATVGVIFGYYPARRAARLDPIECLRYE